jgi:hypothetical protein
MVELRLFNDRFVLCVVEGSAPRHLTNVNHIGKVAVQVRSVDGQAFAGAQALFLKFQFQPLERVLAGFEKIEHPPDPDSLRFVDNVGLVLLLANRHVSIPRFARKPPFRNLFGLAFTHFLGQIVSVILGKNDADAPVELFLAPAVLMQYQGIFHQVDLPFGILVQPLVNFHGVLKVSGKAIHFLDKEAFDAFFLDVRHHLVEDLPLLAAGCGFADRENLDHAERFPQSVFFQQLLLGGQAVPGFFLVFGTDPAKDN